MNRLHLAGEREADVTTKYLVVRDSGGVRGHNYAHILVMLLAILRRYFPIWAL